VAENKSKSKEVSLTGGDEAFFFADLKKNLEEIQ